MKIGIMQPYFIPYIGYWQLLNAVDKYIVYDDVNFIKGGWINRNRILINGEPKYFNIQMRGASSNKKINEIEVAVDVAIINKNIRVIQAAYSKAPYYADVYPIIEEILNCKLTNLAEYIVYSIKTICSYLGITTEIILSSTLEKDNSLKGQDKVLDICSMFGATEYYNAIGGRTLYSFDKFLERGIRLVFLKTDNIEYSQFCNEFQPNLSILDVMMFNSKEKLRKMLGEFSLITAGREDENSKLSTNCQ